MDQDYLDIEIKNIRPIVPARLYQILSKYGIRNLRSLLAYPGVEFAKLQGVGRKTFVRYEKFIDLLQREQELVRSTWLENRERELPLQPAAPGCGAFLGNFIAIVNDYLSIAANSRELDVIVKRFKIHDDRFYSLEEIATQHGITRERVRQIEAHALSALRQLLNGETLQTPFCRCSTSALLSFRDIREELFSRPIVAAVDMFDVLWQRYHIGMDDVEERYVVLLLAVWKTRELDYRDHLYLITDDALKNKTCLHLLRIVTKILVKQVVPLSQDDLIAEVRSRWKPFSDDRRYIMAVMEAFRETETIMIDAKPFYRLRFEDLRASTDQAYRIFLEQQVPLYYADLGGIINERLESAGSSRRVDPDSLKAQMCTDHRFVPRGKSGIWRLKEWDEAGRDFGS